MVKKTNSNKKENMEKGGSNSNLIEIVALWKHDSKAGNMYLSGTAKEENETFKVIAFFNDNKSDNQPDIRVYEATPEGDELGDVLISLWKNKSKAGNVYLSGKDNEGKKILGFYNNSDKDEQPYLKLYIEGEE